MSLPAVRAGTPPMPSRGRWRAVFASLLLAVVAAASGGCAVLGPPQDVLVTVSAGADLNRDDEGRPLSVVLRVYQLRDAAPFTEATLEALVRRDREALDAAWIDRVEEVLIPGDMRELRLRLAPDARYVAVVALFRRPDPQRSRRLFDVRRLEAGGIRVRAEACLLRVMDARGASVDPPPAERVDCPARSTPPAPSPRPAPRRATSQ